MEGWGEVRIRKTEVTANTRDDFENRAYFVDVNSVTCYRYELRKVG